MKKSVLLLAATFGVTGAFAQDLTSKKGEKYLPEANDWAIGIDATPFLNYAGSLLSNGGATAPTVNFLGGTNSIMGKLFKDEKTAYRAGIRIGLNSNKEKSVVADRTVTTAPTYPAIPATKENTWKTSNNNIFLTAGLEKRRGSTRLQGYYGAEVGLGIGTSKDKFEYGNALATSGTIVTVNAADEFTGAGNLTTDTYGNAARVTEKNNGTLFAFGARGFVGAEYFILPKISLGGEFGWGLGFAVIGASSVTTESISGSTIGTQTVEGGKSSNFILDTDDSNSIFGPSASIRLNLHF